jgi:hypothetical protein
VADIGFRAVLSVNDGSGNAQTAFPGLVTVGFPKRKVGEKDVTAHDNTTDGTTPSHHKVYIPTLIDSDLIPVELHYTAAQYRRLDALLGQRKIGPSNPKVDVAFVIKAPPVEEAGVTGGETSPQQMTVRGYLASLEGPVFNREDEMVLKVEIRANNKPVLAEGDGA